jgi:hypothetical protein
VARKPLRLPRSLYYSQNLGKIVEAETKAAMAHIARNRLSPETRAILEAHDNPDHRRAVQRAREDMEAHVAQAMRTLTINRK